MPISGKKITVDMIPLCFLNMKGTCVTPSPLIRNTSSEITFRKAHIRSYPHSTFVLQNKVSTESKTETAENITIYKMTERLEPNNILDVTDDEGAIHLLLNLKYIMIFS